MKRLSRDPRRRWRLVLSAAAAFVLFAATVALLVNTVPLATSWLGSEVANTNVAAGSAVVHDDAGDTRGCSYPLRAGRATGLATAAGSAVIHDDAGNVATEAAAVVIHDAGNLAR